MLFDVEQGLSLGLAREDAVLLWHDESRFTLWIIAIIPSFVIKRLIKLFGANLIVLSDLRWQAASKARRSFLITNHKPFFFAHCLFSESEPSQFVTYFSFLPSGLPFKGEPPLPPKKKRFLGREVALPAPVRRLMLPPALRLDLGPLGFLSLRASEP